MAGQVYLVEDGYGIRGIAPPDLRRYPEDVKRLYWSWIVDLGLRAKDRDLARGLDAKGEPLRRITAETRKHRRSAMTPSGKGDPSAYPLEPGRQKSRVRSLLAGKAFPDHAEFFWRFDPFTFDSFARILEYQRDEGRDVFGLSPAALRRVTAQSWELWGKYKAGKPIPALPITHPGAVVIPTVGAAPGPFATLGIGVPARAESTGGLSISQWIKHFRTEAPVVLPGRGLIRGNILLSTIYRWFKGA